MRLPVLAFKILLVYGYSTVGQEWLEHALRRAGFFSRASRTSASFFLCVGGGLTFLLSSPPFFGTAYLSPLFFGCFFRVFVAFFRAALSIASLVPSLLAFHQSLASWPHFLIYHNQGMASSTWRRSCALRIEGFLVSALACVSTSCVRAFSCAASRICPRVATGSCMRFRVVVADVVVSLVPLRCAGLEETDCGLWVARTRTWTSHSLAYSNSKL
ncbi:hypothetical protein MSAN_01325200 [Mycena sanguinolenta]|uniref:Transmembrane protein n=1 Tax=Mycena sanguinolenta TaxID=230812 RepID=A0A8H7D3E2_9AGAR|nr:hypothetical protein MSAN_01325200 [Mycena sanguinolenta]